MKSVSHIKNKNTNCHLYFQENSEHSKLFKWIQILQMCFTEWNQWLKKKLWQLATTVLVHSQINCYWLYCTIEKSDPNTILCLKEYILSECNNNPVVIWYKVITIMLGNVKGFSMKVIVKFWFNRTCQYTCVLLTHFMITMMIVKLFIYYHCILLVYIQLFSHICMLLLILMVS